MAGKESIIEVITDAEELPTDVRRRYLRISALTDDDKERIRELMNKLDALIAKTEDTQVINNIIELKSKLTQIMVYISKLEEKIDMLPLDKQKIDYIKDEIKDEISLLSDEIQSTKRSFLSKLDELKSSISSLAVDVTALDDINISVSEIKEDVKGSINASLSDIGDNVRASLSDIESNVKIATSKIGYDVSESVSEIGESVKASVSEIREDFRQSVSDVSERFYEIEASLNSRIEGIKSLMEQSSEDIDKTLTALYVIRDVINKTSENIDVSAESLKDMSVSVNEKLGTLSNFVETVDSARIQLEDNIKAMQTVKNNIEGYVSSLDKRTDDVLNVVYGKVTELDKIKNDLESKVSALGKSTKNMTGVSVKLEDNITLLDDLRISHKKVEKEAKNIAKKINKTARDMKGSEKDFRKSINMLNSVEKEIKKKDATSNLVLNELKRFNIHLSKLDEAEFLYRIFEIKKHLKKYKRLPKWAAERRDLLLRSVLLFEDELIDISVIYALTKGDSSFTQMRRLTGVGEGKLRKSLKKLVAEKRVKKYRKGRFVVYSIAV